MRTKDMKAMYVSKIDEWIQKMWYVCTTDCYSVIKKNMILPYAATQTDCEDVMLSEISQMEKDKYCIMTLICGIQKYNNLVNTRDKKQTRSYREQTMVTSGVKGKIGLGEWEAQTNVVQYREYSQYFVITVNGV